MIDGSPRSIARAYDSYGRLASYTDADANTTATSYDTLDRPVLIVDGKGSSAFTYDSLTGDLARLSVSGIGDFTGTYDANGRLVSERLPDAVVARTAYDEDGQPFDLTYQDCTGACRDMLDLTVSKSVHDQVRSQVWTGGSQGNRRRTFVYDRAARVTAAYDVHGGTCSFRGYTYDADSNLVEMATGTDASGVRRRPPV